MESLVHETPVDSAEDLGARIVVAADVINTTRGIFERMRQSFLRRCELCNVTRGRHFERLLTLKQDIHLSSKMDFLEHGNKKSIVEVENLSNLEQIIRNGGIQKNLKSKTQSVDSNLRPRCEGSGKTKDLPTSVPRVEARNETRNPPMEE
ncbi:hypothetical protein AVEN_232111-1 [Araneus ventricosus]|uniref:Uncharacterized protein n=1 Tax=Araneus ventricosus TaxID=182803 RepID=A0A4Y2FVC4_ARAVE|nr:hypothetical protein AVEN_232111-1 [Araneus ventricosus]